MFGVSAPQLVMGIIRVSAHSLSWVIFRVFTCLLAIGIVQGVLIFTGDQGPPGVSPPFNSTELAGDRGDYGPPGFDGLPGLPGDPGVFFSFLPPQIIYQLFICYFVYLLLSFTFLFPFLCFGCHGPFLPASKLVLKLGSSHSILTRNGFCDAQM